MNDSFESARQHFLDGVRRYEAGDAAAAALCFEAALARVPGRVSVLVNLAAARLQLAQPRQALTALDEALAAEPQHADAWCHRGIACSELGRDDDALHSFDRALALEPGQVPARYHRAATLNRRGRHAQALDALDGLLRDAPAHSQAWMLHGQTLQSLGRHAQAQASYEQALALDPALGRAWSHLGHLLNDLGQPQPAALAFERAAACGDERPMNHYFLAALTGREAPPATPPAYVRALFDSYAQDFETHLVQTLHYRAHALVVQAAQAALLPGPGLLSSALDLGCGTGLCGPLLRPLARQLTGVDLSPTMLARSAERAVYDDLVQADIAEHLQHTPRRHALVVAADVFIYIGDLDAVFAGVRRVLQAGGVFAFSVEATGDEHGWQLRRSFRYAHSERYLRALSAAHGFELLALQTASLREEQRQAIEGRIVCLRAP
ncbi:tetratricopeptide repeat protein [Aquabacterium sp.]|uniref:tetratricopeptide repeat protein n=1 Tax=Aquabacterium sp. TaxID=1872578 RepID=UPI002C9C0EB0|nr:tetratricopeptide repeat protein [Aquabacterium sp.]HSW04202.1 tetratricopeptide repeat protein [Aquabacterium sp.]